MSNNRKFVADVEAFKRLTIDKMLRVAKQSLQDVIREAQTTVAQGGNMPVDSGYLRNSLIVTVAGVERARGDPDAGPNSNTGNEAVILGLSALELGDPFQVAWTAEYALQRHYTVGVGHGGGMWRDLAAQKWQGIVQSNARKAAARS